MFWERGVPQRLGGYSCRLWEITLTCFIGSPQSVDRLLRRVLVGRHRMF